MSEAYEGGVGAADAGYESSAEAGGDGGYYETQAETEARIADQDQLGTPQESHAVTWGDDPDDYGETDYNDETGLAAEYDADTSAFIAGQDELPTPQESHVANWGDHPEYYDERDLAAEYDGDLSALTTEGDSPAAQHDPASPAAEDGHAESAVQLEDPVGSHAHDADAGHRDQDAATTPDDEPDQAGTDLTTAESDREPQAREAAEPSADADPGQADQAEKPERDGGDALSPEPDRLKAVETELDAARQEVADLKAQLADQGQEYEAKLEEQGSELLAKFEARLEQWATENEAKLEEQKANTDRQPESTNPQEQGTDQARASRRQDSAQDEHEGSYQETDPKVAAATRGSRWRAAVTGEHIQDAGTLLGAAEQMGQFAMHATPGGLVGLIPVVLGVAGYSMAKWEKYRKERHDRQNQRQAREGNKRSNN